MGILCCCCAEETPHHHQSHESHHQSHEVHNYHHAEHRDHSISLSLSLSIGHSDSSEHHHHTHHTAEVHHYHHAEHPVNMYGSAEPKDDDFYKRPPHSGNGAILATDSSETEEFIEYEYPIYKYKTESNKWTTLTTLTMSRDLAKIGIVTQCSMDRLSELQTMCQSWNGLISVAIYIKNGDDDIVRIQKVFDKLVADNDNIQLEIHLIYQNNENEYYPINYLRNIALNNCQCDYVFLLDIDFVCSPNLYFKLLPDLLSLKINQVFVIPAFELKHYHHPWPLDKDELIERYNNGEITAFHCDRFPVGHHATNYRKWIKSKRNYKVEYEHLYEPYIVVKNDDKLCRYDERFSGYGMNKIIHITQMAIKDKYKFLVFNDGFVTASKHELSADYKRTYGKRKRSNVRKKWLMSLYDKAMCEIQSFV